MDITNLVKKASEASLNSYSPYSHFKVGASLITKDGTIYTGTNIENASYGLCNCAERTCLFTAYAAGVRKDDIVAFCVYTPNETPSYPCGACRQVMSELLNESTPVYVGYGKDNKYLESSVKELIPFSFSAGDLND